MNKKDAIINLIENAEKIPDNSLIFLDYKDLLEIMTKKRLEIVDIVSKLKPKSLQELANITKRKKQAINRDLRILERHNVLKLEKKGRTITPKVNKQIILFQIPYKKKNSKHSSEGYQNKKAINSSEVWTT